MADQLATAILLLLQRPDMLRRPDGSRVRFLPSIPEATITMDVADFVACQRSNPLIEHDLMDLVLWDLADRTLAFFGDPHNFRHGTR